VSSTNNCSHVTPRAAFVTTQWTRILEARGDSPAAKTALSDLCAAYYAPVFAFIRRTGRDEDAARELTQEFFARMLGRPSIENVDPQRGRFRSFLLGAVKHFLSDVRERDQAAKRGSGTPPLSLDARSDTSTDIEVPDPHTVEPEKAFDRQWALTILEHALAKLEEEQRAAGGSAQFELLKAWLTGDAEPLSQAEAARRLDMTEGAVKVAVHRLRKRFRELVKAEIAETVAGPSQVQEELRYLIEVLG
jgi:RNA polymerase sigma-70 factor (ECF subfamily)